MSRRALFVRVIIWVVVIVACGLAESHSHHEIPPELVKHSIQDLNNRTINRSHTKIVPSTRHSRRFSRPHKLVDLAKSKSVLPKCVEDQSVAVTSSITTEPSHSWSTDNSRSDVARSCASAINTSNHRAGLNGGGESAEEEIVDPSAEPSATNDTMDNHSILEPTTHSYTDTDKAYESSSTAHTTTHHPHTTITIHPTLHYNLSTYTEPIKPYLSRLLQYASDAYDSKLAQQNATIIRNVTHAAASKLKWSLFPKIRRSTNADTATDAHTSTEDVSLGNSWDTNDDTFSSSITVSDSLPEEQEPPSHHTVNQLEYDVTVLRSVVNSKDDIIQELVARLAALEQELNGVRTQQENRKGDSDGGDKEVIRGAESIVKEAVGSSSGNSKSSDCTNDNATDYSTESDSAPYTANDATDSTTITTGIMHAPYNDTYELLHGVLNALYRINVLMEQEQRSSNTATTDTSTTDFPHQTTEPITDATNNATEAINTTTLTTPVPLIPRPTYPSIVDEVLLEREQAESLTQRVHDIAVVSSVQWHSDSARLHSDELIQAHIDVLTNRTLALEYELRQASRQLCHLRGQTYHPHTVNTTNTSPVRKRRWFTWFG